MYSNNYRLKCISVFRKVFPSLQVKETMLLQSYATFRMLSARDDYGHVSLFSLYEQIRSTLYYQALFDIFDLRDMSVFPPELARLYDVPLRHFLRFATPTVVADVDAFLSFLDGHVFLDQDAPEFAACAVHHLISIKHTAFRQSEGKSLAMEDALDRLYAVYCAIERRKEMQWNRSEFASVYKAINHYPLQQAELEIPHASKKNVLELVHLFCEKLEEPRNRQLAMAADYYVRNMQEEELLSEYAVPQFSVNRDANERKNFLRQAIKLMAKSRPLDVLCGLHLGNSITKRKDPIPAAGRSLAIARNNVTLENGLIYSLFTSSVMPAFSADSHIAVLFPTPFFVRKWLDDVDLTGIKCTFVFKDSATRDLLQYHYSEGSYANKLDGSVFFLDYSLWIANRDEGNAYTKVLLFAATNTISEQNAYIRDIKAKAVNAPMEIYTLISGKEYANTSSPFADELKDAHLNLKSIAIIPQGINNATNPRRKLFLKTVYAPASEFIKSDTQNRTELVSYTLNTDFKVQALSRVYSEKGPIFVSQSDLHGLDCSVRDIFRQELLHRRAAGREKNIAISYDFSPDITIWCSKSYPKKNNGHPRIEAYICEPADPQKAERGYLERGLRIDDTLKRTTSFTGDDLCAWLEYEYPYAFRTDRNYYRDERKAAEAEGAAITLKPAKPRVSIREAIIKSTAERFAQKNLALKTIWYIYPCVEDLYSGRDVRLLTEMMCGDLGWLYAEDTSEEAYIQSLLDCYPEEPAEAIRHRCQILYTLLEFARKKGHCSENALAEFVTDERRSKKALSRIRSNMVVKSLTLDEFFAVFDEAVSLFEAGKTEYLGVLIRLCTGLESNIVCALRWGDFALVDDYQIYRLAVTRQVANDGKTLFGFASMEDYRLLACCRFLTNCLLEQRERVKAELSKFYGGSLDDFPIVISSESPKTGYRDYKTMLSPIVLEKISKDVLAKADIEDHVVVVPDSLKGTKETNLSHYQGDFFRENFKYWIRDLCKFTADELANYVGNKGVTTFGRHYCDFQNDAALLVSYVKLQRLDALLTNREKIRAYRYSGSGISVFEQEFALPGRAPMSVHIILKARGGNGRLKVTIKSQFGLNAYVSELFCEE